MVKKKSGKRCRDAGMEEWITALAQQQQQVEDGTRTGRSSSKAERIEKRLLKKQKREEQKQKRKNGKVSNQDSQQHLIHNNMNKDHVDNSSSRQIESLSVLSERVKDVVNALQENNNNNNNRMKVYKPIIEKLKKKKNKHINDVIQPRKSDYGGIGLARCSLYISLDDPSWIPKLQEEFNEHIPGFFGKQRTKAMKKQQTNMLWKKLQAAKNNNNIKVNGKKLSDMNANERVEAMIKAGML